MNRLDDSLAQLKVMGFEESQAREALSRYNGDLDRAIDSLLRQDNTSERASVTTTTTMAPMRVSASAVTPVEDVGPPLAHAICVSSDNPTIDPLMTVDPNVSIVPSEQPRTTKTTTITKIPASSSTGTSNTAPFRQEMNPPSAALPGQSRQSTTTKTTTITQTPTGTKTTTILTKSPASTGTGYTIPASQEMNPPTMALPEQPRQSTTTSTEIPAGATTTATTSYTYPPAGPVMIPAPSIPFLGRTPKAIQCPYCRVQMMTRPKDRVDTVTLVIVVILLVFIWPLFWIPLVVPGCQSTDHYCSHCNRKIGTTEACED